MCYNIIISRGEIACCYLDNLHQVHTMNTNAEMAAAVVAAWETDLVDAVIKVCEAYDCSLAELRAQLAAFEKEALS